MNANKKLVLGIIIIVSFLYFVFNISSYLFIPSHDAQCAAEVECPHEKQLDFIYSAIPLLASIALIVGAGTYYLMSQKVESKDKSLKNNTEVLLKFLSVDEKKLVSYLIENNGKVLQAEITRLPEMNKVKSHRVVQKLIDRGVLEIERIGKTNRIRFTKEIREGLF